MASVAQARVLPGMEAHERAEIGRTDHFPTPEWVTQLLLDRLSAEPKAILEPACGTGSICRVLRRHYQQASICAIEIRDELVSPWLHDWRSIWRGDCAAAQDFHRWSSLVHGLGESFDLVITNPPYGNDEPVRFFESAWPLVADGGQLAMLLRLNWLASSKRAAFHREHPADVYVVSRRIAFLDNGSSPTESHAWFVWTKGSTGGRWEVLS
jgi:methylase of polypeptide subunit release factors